MMKFFSSTIILAFILGSFFVEQSCAQRIYGTGTGNGAVVRPNQLESAQQNLMPQGTQPQYAYYNSDPNSYGPISYNADGDVQRPFVPFLAGAALGGLLVAPAVVAAQQRPPQTVIVQPVQPVYIQPNPQPVYMYPNYGAIPQRLA